MKLLDKIISDMHLSMKSGDRIKADTLRTLIAKLRDQEIKSRKKTRMRNHLRLYKL